MIIPTVAGNPIHNLYLNRHDDVSDDTTNNNNDDDDDDDDNNK